MVALLKELRKKVVIGFVGGSDLAKITEQLAVNGEPGKCQQRVMIPRGFNWVPFLSSCQRFRLRICGKRLDGV
jgi:hypothetical protein